MEKPSRATGISNFFGYCCCLATLPIRRGATTPRLFLTCDRLYTCDTAGGWSGAPVALWKDDRAIRFDRVRAWIDGSD
jgi:hypothetical protein